MRLYKYSNKGIEITDAVRDKEPVGIIMPNKSVIKPDFNNMPYGQIKKAIIFVYPNMEANYRLEIY